MKRNLIKKYYWVYPALFVGILSACSLSTSPSTPAKDTPSSSPTASSPIIAEANASDLSQVQEISQPEANLFAWLPEGEAMVLANEQAVYLYEASPETTSQAASSPIKASSPKSLAVSSSGETLAVVTQNDQVHLYDLASGKQIEVLDAGQGAVTGVSFSPVDDMLASTTSLGEIQVWNAPGNETIQEIDYGSLLVQPDFSPQGDRLAGVDLANFAVPLFDPETGEQERTLRWSETSSPALYGASFSPDWSRLAWVARNTVQLMAVDSGVFGPTLNHEDFVNDVAWSPDAKLLAVSTAATIEGELQPAVLIWDPATGKSITTLAQPEPVLSLSFSPDGRSLAVLLYGGDLQLWAVP